MRTTLTRILLVPAVAVAAIAFAAPAAQAAPSSSATAAQSTLYNGGDSGQWGGGNGNGYYGYGYDDDNDGLLDSLFQCGLLSLLLGGCDLDD